MCLGIPGLVVEIIPDPAFPVGVVQFGGVSRRVSLAFVEGVARGDHVVVHAGVAIARIDPEEAARTLALLEEVDREAWRGTSDLSSDGTVT
ncbi:MAG: HypC/HybG/HupF family hydrogenase formation chaperone [Isosphaeraceae bacterium]|nr:HypC/HybG/HupF family hydrogenase formation chaperone [Isosphaeraceae bacterium]